MNSTSILSLLLALTFGSAVGQAAVLYSNDFQQSDPGSIPDDLMVMDGRFAVVAEGDSRFLELPGAPLETYGVLFGPVRMDGVTVSARIYGTGKGRRFPAFSVSLGGVNGYKLQVTPSKQQVEILSGDRPVASTPWKWTSDAWTLLELQIRSVDATTWVVEGRVWTAGQPKPDGWTISMQTKDKPIAGKAGIWGKPYAGTPVRFDDLKVTGEE